MGAFDTSVGVLLIGLFFNTYLYGLVTCQFIVYANTKFNDPLWIRGIVYTLFITDTLHSAVVTNYNNPASLAFVSWTIPFTAIATAVTAILTQYFLGHRVFVLTKSKPLSVLIGLLSTLGFIFGVYAGLFDFLLTVIFRVAHFAPLKPFVICWLGFQTSADLVITFILTFILSRSRTGFRTTDTIINRLIRGAVQTGLFASIFALADLFTFVLHPGTNLYAMFAYPIGRIYTNTLLDTLNARIELKSMTATHDVDSESNANAFRMQTSSQTIAGKTPHSINVKKETTTHISPDEQSNGKQSVEIQKYTNDDIYGYKMA
ncbi:hypothetical protein H0H81_004995 [Sphagnurus paluster]|uniref:DUF6534 domain-containing protein n=1 Tax=Sphagnurus paluster TaxID=117069 RepID=A0A9P7KHB4_9AGAR|nr:hypothetical protein H0H81_004995 [Sphagnurus paluster]